MKKRLLRILGIPIFIYFVVIIISCNMQTKMIFFPTVLDKAYEFKTGEEVFITTKDSVQINALYFNKNAPKTILYFHGNAGALDRWQNIYRDFENLNVNFLIIDYRSYGKSNGKISEKGLYLDGQAAYDYLNNNLNVSAKNIIIYGRSIGTGIAVEVAAKNNINGLILEAPFNNLRKFVSNKYPYLLPQLYLKYSFKNDKKINDVTGPLLIIHGTIDRVIPLKYSSKLFEKRKENKKMIVIEGGGHNNLNSSSEYHNAIKEFIEG